MSQVKGSRTGQLEAAGHKVLSIQAPATDLRGPEYAIGEKPEKENGTNRKQTLGRREHRPSMSPWMTLWMPRRHLCRNVQTEERYGRQREIEGGSHQKVRPQ